MKLLLVLNLFFLGCHVDALEYDGEACQTPDKVSGFCVNVTNCKTMTDFIISLLKIDEEIKKYLHSYVCGYDQNNDVKVCCPQKPIQNPFAKRDRLPADKLKLLPLDTCGIDKNFINNIILNGFNTNLLEFPWMALLLYSDVKDPYKCGGSLINNRYVLTSAHCIQTKNVKLVGVRLGEYNHDTEIDCDETGCLPPVQNFEATQEDAVVHPDYNSSTLANDIALIRLRHEANTTVVSVAPICLPIDDNINYEREYIVAGWGLTETGYRSPTLQKAFLTISPPEECMMRYSNAKSYVYHEHQLCMNGGPRNQNSCSGDSGGPLMMDTLSGHGPRMVQYGLVSFGIAGCQMTIRHDFPSVFTNLIPFVDWIVSTIQP